MNNRTSLPTFNKINDLEIVFGETNLSLNWIVWTDVNVRIDIARNGIEIFSTMTDRPIHIPISIEGIFIGLNTYTIKLYREDDLLVEDSTIVYVVASPALISSVLVTATLVTLVLALEIHRRQRLNKGHRPSALNDHSASEV